MRSSLLYLLLSLAITGNLMSQSTNNTGAKKMISMLDSFVNAFNAHNADVIISLMTDDCIFQASAGPDVDGEKFTGKAAVKKAFENVFITFPDAHWGSAKHFISGDRAVSEWIFKGTKQDGSRVEVTGCDLFTFRNGKIAIKNSYRKNRTPLHK